jgi:quercetin dioxygenase-like cupin family protein
MREQSGGDENAMIGEQALVRVGSEKTAGSRVLADLYVGPGGFLVGEHSHPALRERFTVIRGRVGFRLDGRRSVASAGKSVEVPPGVKYDWWNAGDEEAHVLLEIAPAMARLPRTPGAPGMLQAVLVAVIGPIAQLLGLRS